MSAVYKREKFKDVAVVVTGNTPSTKNDEFFGGDIPFVTPAELGQDPVIEAKTNLTKLGAEQGRLLPSETVMVSCIGTLGKVGFAGREVVTNQQINSLIFDKKQVFPRYGYHFCKTIRPYMEHIAPSTTLPIINKGRFSDFEIPLPPLEEQRRIAEVLDMADALRQKRRLALQKLDTLLQSVFLDMFGDTVTNPRGWSVGKFSDVFHFTTGKLDSNAMVEGAQYPFFTCAQETFAIDKYAFDCEALLLAGNNATADYSVKHFKGKFNAYQRTYVITLKRTSDSYTYMKFALENKLLDLKRISKGTNTKYLTLQILNRLELQVPDASLQKDFGITTREIQKRRDHYLISLSKLDSLFVSIQNRAFNGGLFSSNG